MSPRLPLREVDEAEADPRGYRARLYGSPRQAQGSVYVNALRNAIFNFHKPRWNVAHAEAYLQERLAGAPNNAKKAETLDQFHWYLEQYEALGWPTALTRLNLHVSLPPEGPIDLSLSGQVARVDFAPSGRYAGWVFVSGTAAGWRRGLRMPLIQEALAEEMNVPTEEAIVGIYAFGDRTVDRTSFTADEIAKARSSLKGLLQRLSP
jgi:hypothetical protein